MKYLTFLVDGLPTLICFSGNLSHDHVARCLGIREVRSAGFICRTATGLYCHSASETLNVASLVGDSKLAEAYFK